MQILTSISFAVASLTLGEIVPWTAETPRNSIDDPAAAAFVGFLPDSGTPPFLVAGNAKGIISYTVEGTLSQWTSTEAIAALDNRPGNPSLLVGINPVSKQLLSWSITPDGASKTLYPPSPFEHTASVMPLAIQIRGPKLYALTAVSWNPSSGGTERRMILFETENNVWKKNENSNFILPTAGVADDRTGMFYGIIEDSSIVAGASTDSNPTIIIYAVTTKPQPVSLGLYTFGSDSALLLVLRSDGTLEIYDANAQNRARAKFLGTANFASKDGTRLLNSASRMAFLPTPSAEISENTPYPSGMLAIYDSKEKNFKLIPWHVIAGAFKPNLPGAIVENKRVGDDAGTNDAGTSDSGTNDAGTSDSGTDSGTDAGTGPKPPVGCGCSTANSSWWTLLAVGVAFLLARRRRYIQ